jgi:ABC-2 type transport system permease protein
MIRTYYAELTKILRRRVVVATAAVSLLFAVGGAAIILIAADAAGPVRDSSGGTPTLQSLAAAGGGTDVFRVAVAFTGTFLFVVFVGLTAAEFARGTIRTMLLRQPLRGRLLAGKLAALLTYAAGTLAVTEVLTWTAARILAPGAGVDAGAGTSLHALGAAIADYGVVLLWISGYAVLGMTVGVLVRSVPVALAVGIAWAGPFEHIVQNAWVPAGRWFPGLLLEAVAAGGTTAVTATRALTTVGLYVVIAALIAFVVFDRRDVTA